MTHLEKLVRHCIWANQTWTTAIENDVPDDPYLMRLMSHVLLAEQIWFQRIRSEATDPNVWNVLPLVDIQTIQARHVALYAAIVDGDLERIVAYQRFTGERYRSSVADILLHLCTHGAHHRGQMASYTSGLGRTPPNADFIHFCMAHQL